MAATIRLAIVSDIHYASAREQARGNDYELRGIANPLLRRLLAIWRRFVWQREPLHQNYLLENFLARTGGRFCHRQRGLLMITPLYRSQRRCGVPECARSAWGNCVKPSERNLRATFGDHELGKLSFFGGQGGMRLASWHRAQQELGLEPFWRVEIGRYVLMAWRLRSWRCRFLNRTPCRLSARNGSACAKIIAPRYDAHLLHSSLASESCSFAMIRLPCLSLAGRRDSVAAPARRANHDWAPSFKTDFLEEPYPGRDATNQFFGPHAPAPHGRVARGPLLDAL